MQNSGETASAEPGPSASRPEPLLTRARANAARGLLMSVAFAVSGVLLHGLEPWGALFGSPGPQSATPSTLAATGLLHLLLALALTSSLREFGQPRLRLLRTQLGILGTVLLIGLVSRAVLVNTELSVLWLPVGLLPLWTTASFDRQAGSVVAVVMAFMLASLAGLDGVVLSVLLVRGIAATLWYSSQRTQRRFLPAAILAGATAALMLLLSRALAGEPLALAVDLSSPAESLLFATLGAGVVEGVTASVLRPLAERALGRVSRERLLQLTDLEQPLLQRLARDAPGTFEHSRAMANLAEQAASSIGADALLTRVGAYYHDLGKTIGAKHFVENLGPGEASPHDELEPEESARRIVRHVVEGARMLREGGIPEPVVEFAYTHHGSQTLEYFLNKFCRKAGAERARTADIEAAFRYPGMKPQTKETAILMLVDSIEAASRTIDPPDRLRFQQMVQRVVDTKLQQGQLDESNLSLAELRVIQARMVETLAHMHHHRIKYPWQAERAEQFGVPASAVGLREAVAPCEPDERALAGCVEPLRRGARR